MSSDLIQQLRRLQRGFSALCTSEADADALFDDAVAFGSEITHTTVDRGEGQQVSSALATLVQQFAVLNQALLAAPELDAALCSQLDAACVALRYCTNLAEQLPLTHNDTFRLGSALALVFGAGLALLRSQAIPALAAQPGSQGALQSLLNCSNQLAAAASVLRRAGNPLRQPEAATAFTRTAGRPQFVLPWRLTVSQALLAAPREFDCAVYSANDTRYPKPDWYASTLARFADAARSLLLHSNKAYDDAVQQAPAVRQAVISVLLDRCLPLLAAEASPDTLANRWHPHVVLACCLGHAVSSACLDNELAQRMQQPGGAAHLQQALQVLVALPLRRSPASVEAASFGEQHMGAATLLGHLSTFGSYLPTNRLASLARQLVAALPRIATMLAGLAADSSLAPRLLARMCFPLCVAVPILHAQLPAITSNGQLAAWAAACAAALRLVPLLLQLHERCESLDEGTLRDAPLCLARALLAFLDSCLSAAHYVATKSIPMRQPPAADEQLLRQLWALHTSMCRLVAWLAADPSSGRAALVLGADKCSDGVLLKTLSLLRFILLHEADSSIQAGILSEECVHGMCAAHWAALQAALHAMGGLPGCNAELLERVVVDLGAISLACRLLLDDASLVALFSGALAQLAPTLTQFFQAQCAALDTAEQCPQLAAAMARNGILSPLVREAQGLERRGDADAAAGLAAVVGSAFHSLDLAASEAAGHLSTAAPQQLPLLQQLRQAAGISAGLVHRQGAAIVAQLPELSSRLSAAAKLADLLHQWWQPAMQPEAHGEAQLALGQAAATRSCAYLRCTNLGGEGGPAAGEGAGSQRCSACRAVWYCGTACSHADWREGGHRRVCRALGAARRAAKEAAAAAATAQES